jgi:hypothetical protein
MSGKVKSSFNKSRTKIQKTQTFQKIKKREKFSISFKKWPETFTKKQIYLNHKAIFLSSGRFVHTPFSFNVLNGPSIFVYSAMAVLSNSLSGMRVPVADVPSGSL